MVVLEYTVDLFALHSVECLLWTVGQVGPGGPCIPVPLSLFPSKSNLQNSTELTKKSSNEPGPVLYSYFLS